MTTTTVVDAAECFVVPLLEGVIAESIELLLALAPECGPTNRRKLHRFIEAYVENAPDEDFEVEPVVDREARQLELLRKYSRAMGIVVLDGVLDDERIERGSAEP